MSYQPHIIEPKWQKFWADRGVFCAESQSKKPKYYVLDMFPYPSSAGLHVGHPEGYTATDIVARYKRACGFNVLHPMGWDAFGLPAEQYALKTGISPEKTTQKAIENFRRQLQALGLSYDWSREISTCHPDFYRWTQFLFLKLYEKGLAYQKEVPVNWCPALKTVLANEEVIDGKSQRGAHPVYRILMKQWMLKITAYAERLLKDLDTLDWPESTKELQRNWIGRSEGLQLIFQIAGDARDSVQSIEVFTTRPETLWGVTYLVLAPEHPQVSALTRLEQRLSVQTYQQQVSQKSEITRKAESYEKTGVFTGAYAVHPLTQEPIPIWVADYVLMDYGTGAVMAVPAHDQRDWDFAKTWGLRIQPVIQPEGDPNLVQECLECWTGEGNMIHSGFINGFNTQQAKEAILKWAEEHGYGQRRVQYKLRDWLFSRQRYWGEPFPLVHLSDGSIETVSPEALPVLLPAVESYEPTASGESPLATAIDWRQVVSSKTGQIAYRETDTMPGSAGSSWYFLRFCDPQNASAPLSLEAEQYWMPVDLYVGGPEHAVGHLLYARFWTKVLYDLGWVSHSEPFKKLVHQGMILGEDGEKMSKSRGNVINPDEIIEKYGADTLRIYEMFMGPLEKDKPWSTTAIEGSYRFLQRSWRLFDSPITETPPSVELLTMIHQTIQKVTEDIENLHFNTAISQMMIFVNAMTQITNKPRNCLKIFVQLLQPFAPHLAEELWEKLGETTLLTYAPWPQVDPRWVQKTQVTVVIQVLGKTRGKVEVGLGASQAEVQQQAQQIPAVVQQLQGKNIKKMIFVQDRILNFLIE